MLFRRCNYESSLAPYQLQFSKQVEIPGYPEDGKWLIGKRGIVNHMRKKQLLEMPALHATKQMLKIAAQDKPQDERVEYYSGYVENRKVYQYGTYLRASVKHGILKLAFFHPKELQLRSVLPVYEVYFSRRERRFLTFDTLTEKWRTATIKRIEWMSYGPRYAKGYWISPNDANKVKRYFKTDEDPFEAVKKYQEEIREQELVKRHKKITDPWDVDLAVVPSLPKDWERWVDKVGIQQNYILYRYVRGGAKTGYCTFCGKEVSLNHPPHYNEKSKCPRCHHDIVFKSYGKAGSIDTGANLLYLIQRCRGGFVVRCFEASKSYTKGKYDSPHIYWHEIRRTIYNNNLDSRSYYWGLFKLRENRWIATGRYNPFSSWRHRGWWGRVYGRTLPALAGNELRDTGLCDWVKDHKGICDPEEYLEVLKAIPPWEKIWKANLPELSKEVWSGRSSFKDLVADPNAKSLVKILGLDPSRLKRLRLINGNCNSLEWLQYEKRVNRQIPDDILLWLHREDISIRDLSFILDKMSPSQIFNYIQKQKAQFHDSTSNVLHLWKDYLSMASRLHMDVRDEIVYRCKELRKRHDELVREFNRKEDEIRLEELSKEYPNVNSICQALKEKYEFSGRKYAVIAPNGIKDILAEGRELHHCVAASGYYFERIQGHESYILFLRRKTSIKKPFYTLEVEPNGTIRQKRTIYNRQDVESEAISKFLERWQAEVKKRLKESSLHLDEKNPEGQVMIHLGGLQGQPLLGVLNSDLMETNISLAEEEALPVAA